MQAHCERCHDDKDEPTLVQEERKKKDRGGGRDVREACKGKVAEVTVDNLLSARENDEDQGECPGGLLG